YVTARGFVQQTVDFTTPGPEVRVALSPAGRVIVTSSKPARFRLVSSALPRPLWGNANPMGGPVENVPPGSYTLEVLGDDGKTVARSMAIAVAAGVTTTVSVD